MLITFRALARFSHQFGLGEGLKICSKKHSDHLDQVIHLLKRGTERKLQVHGTEEAEQYLREAEDIAVEYDLPKPWLQLVSYRLAHVFVTKRR